VDADDAGLGGWSSSTSGRISWAAAPSPSGIRTRPGGCWPDHGSVAPGAEARLHGPGDGTACWHGTSGAPSPKLGVPIARAYLNACSETNPHWTVDIRAERNRGQKITDLPFLP